MNLIPVAEKVDVKTACQFYGTPDVEMAKMVKGSLEPSTISNGWVLIFESHDTKYTARQGDWIVCEGPDHFFVLRDAGFEAGYSRLQIVGDEDA